MLKINFKTKISNLINNNYNFKTIILKINSNTKIYNLT